MLAPLYFYSSLIQTWITSQLHLMMMRVPFDAFVFSLGLGVFSPHVFMCMLLIFNRVFLSLFILVCTWKNLLMDLRHPLRKSRPAGRGHCYFGTCRSHSWVRRYKGLCKCTNKKNEPFHYVLYIYYYIGNYLAYRKSLGAFSHFIQHFHFFIKLSFFSTEIKASFLQDL